MIHSTLSLRERDECSPHAPLPQSAPASSHRSKSFSTTRPTGSAGGSSQVSTKSRRLAPAGTTMSCQAYSPPRGSLTPLPLSQPSAALRFSTLVCADTLPRPYWPCSSPGPSLLCAGNRAGAANQASGLMALAIKRARTSAGCRLCAADASINKAATPATAGVAMLVPLVMR